MNLSKGILSLYFRTTLRLRQNQIRYGSSGKRTDNTAQLKKKGLSKQSTMKEFGIALIETAGKKKLILTGDMQTKLKILQLELEELQYCGEQVPKSVKDDEWAELLLMKDLPDRLQYYQYLLRNETKAVKKQVKQQERYINWLSKLEAHKMENIKHIIYGFNDNSFLPFVRKSTFFQFYKWRLSCAAKFGQRLIIDMGYSDYMIETEQASCINQLKDMYAHNKKNLEPFHFHFCNVPSSDIFMEKFYLALPQFRLPSFPVEISEKSYLDFYPKEKLVYLTSHTDELLHQFDHDDIYIIGAFVDKYNKLPVSVAKAKKEGLRMAKIPFDYYFSPGKRILTLDLVMKILLTVKDTNNWKKAFEELPPKRSKKQDIHKLSKYKRSAQTQFKSLLYDDEDE